MLKTQTNTKCFHCGSGYTEGSGVRVEDKHFCCVGCKTVFEILQENDLCSYYDLNQSPALHKKELSRKDKYLFLEDEAIAQSFIKFKDAAQTNVSFYIPQIHCSSCLWLLEHLRELHQGIISTRVNFTTKEVFIVFNHLQISLKEVVEMLDSIGYEPHLSLHELTEKKQPVARRALLYKLGIAGFAFSNVMMMSLADYFAGEQNLEPTIARVLSYVSLFISLPVFFYAASEFYVSAWQGLKQKYINIDFPISVAIVVTFFRSVYEIVTQQHHLGYLDSMTGIVFFMLVGRWVQSRTNQALNYDRDFASFLPIALQVVKNGQIVPTQISAVQVNDVFQVFSKELIPLDSMLSKGEALIDYSFVTGERLPTKVTIGEMIYAGGRQMGERIELIAVKPFSQSYLTNLWNHSTFSKDKSKNIYDVIASYFTYIVLFIGAAAAVYWFSAGDNQKMWNALTTVLIVSCPCALLLARQYTFGNLLRIFGMKQFFARSTEALEAMTHINHIVFDKTGTITSKNVHIEYIGKTLNHDLKLKIASILYQSSHPLSILIYNFLNIKNIYTIKNFKETEGQGIEGWVDEQHIKIGSTQFLKNTPHDAQEIGTKVVIGIDNEIIGEFAIKSAYKNGIPKLFDRLQKQFSLSILSGDNSSEKTVLQTFLTPEAELLFNQNPLEKLSYIKKIQSEGKSVMMVGDGLNDAGALKQSEVGIAIVEDGNTFTPACDIIAHGSCVAKLDSFISATRAAQKIVFGVFIFSIIYNVIGLYFAARGELSPMIAAILMPSSSLSIICLTYGLTNYLGKKYFS